MKFDKSDFLYLVEARVILEINIVRLAAERRTQEDIIILEKALKAFEAKLDKGELAVEEDLLFHLKIAAASKNPNLNSLMLMMAPHIISSFIELEVCSYDQYLSVFHEHQIILQHIIDQNGAAASKYMQQHLQDVIDFARVFQN